MELKNKKDGKKYWVSAENDGHFGFMIFARAGGGQATNFCMHYRSLKEFCGEWEDADD